MYISLATPVSTRARKKIVNSKLNQCIKTYIEREYGVFRSADFRELTAAIEAKPPVFVAIKRITATSGPKRIADELTYLKNLKGQHHVLPIVSAARHQDQVIVVSPYFSGMDFRDLIISVTIADIAGYMRLILEALAYVHSYHIMHRDIKPSNFMFAREDNGTFRGLLVDFGLAQMEEQDMSKRAKTVGRKPDGYCPDTLRGSGLQRMINHLAYGYIDDDPRAMMKASRAGTRGFRAPEVLFKVAHQTIAIDIWSVGVILLTLLTKRYPFFQSTDDCDALVELASIFGFDAMKRTARSYDRIWKCFIPTVPQWPIPWSVLISKLNPNGIAVPDECLDLLTRMLDLDYRTRITALEALDHPFLVKH